MIEPLAAARPVLIAPGNHEMASGEAFVNLNARWPMPAASSGSPDNTYWSVDYGPAHVIALNSFANYTAGSLQDQWLRADLDVINRSLTPWVVAVFHVPWYTTSTVHRGEGDAMRTVVEPLLYAAGVDLVVSGHNHLYERSLPVNNGRVDPCGAVHLIVGDGGNREGLYTPWASPARRTAPSDRRPSASRCSRL
eukprot:TRINITY_DN7700_c0_g1_i1.p2 TRINITY_DN7700_c0_g1~~TRINITY_DN7700_c0_g1_i1.p2  ORF type:complete len:194 (+),score=40.55 TRINITY_DN7700_c0_g1_i1:456-1037(+)